MKKLLLVALPLTILACAGTDRAHAQIFKEYNPVPRGGRTPRHFKTYSLFLVCNPLWLAPEKSEGLRQLYQQFQDFGRTIGNDNLAVWFWISTSTGPDLVVPQNVDVERSLRFCTAWKLTPSAGPHVVVTSAYPDESDLSPGLPKNSAVFELGNMSSKEISALLGKLTDELVEKGEVQPVGPWVRLLAATQRTINRFGCAWSFKIDAGPVTANLRSCQTQ
jgi:hypothetical protein